MNLKLEEFLVQIRIPLVLRCHAHNFSKEVSDKCNRVPFKMASLIPLSPVKQSRDEVVQSIRQLHGNTSPPHILTNPEAIICLTRAAGGLTRDSKYVSLLAPEWQRRDHGFDEDTVRRAGIIATQIVNTGDVIIARSIYTEALVDVCYNVGDDEEFQQETIHLLHYLTYKCGWTLTVLGEEDCIYLGEDIICLIKDPLSDTMQSLLTQFNELYGKEAQGIEFGGRKTIEHINPLDRISWRDPKSTPHNKGYDSDEDAGEDASNAFINEDEQQHWDNIFPINISQTQFGGLLNVLYTKLDSTTQYKNHLVAEVVRLKREVVQLNQVVTDLRGQITNQESVGEKRSIKNHL